MEQIYIEKLARIQELLEKYPDESFVLNGIVKGSVLNILKGNCPPELASHAITPVTKEWFGNSLFIGVTGEEARLDSKKYSSSSQITWFQL